MTPFSIVADIMRHRGVEAAGAWSNTSNNSGIQGASFAGTLEGAVSLLRITAQPTIVVHVGGRSIFVLSRGDWTVAAIFVTGDRIARSMRRVLRNAARGPLRPPQTGRAVGPVSPSEAVSP